MEEQQQLINIPLGVIILGRINCFFLGIVFFGMFLSFYTKITPEKFDIIVQTLKNKGFYQEVTMEQFRLAIKLYMFGSCIFFISGLGLMLKKEWGRILTLIFSFIIVIFTLLSVLSQPAIIMQAMIFIIYPGILIFYFTNKNVEKFFKILQKREERLKSF